MTTSQAAEKEENNSSSLDAVLKGLGLGFAMLALIMPGHVTSSQKRVPRAASVVATPAHQSFMQRADFGRHQPSEEARHTANWAVYSGDTQGMPFVILDKKHATVYLFAPDGKLRGSTPVLLGSAVGDHSVPGIGEREIMEILPGERTTPSGRFVTAPGRNASGEDIIWVDYGAAISMHRVRPNVASERRLERLASATTDDNRISFGCINVPIKFYNEMISPVLGTARGVVYVLPETRDVRAEFGSYDIPDAPAVAQAVRTVR